MILAFYFLFNIYFIYIYKCHVISKLFLKIIYTREHSAYFLTSYTAHVLLLLSLSTYKFVSCELMPVQTRERDSSPGFDGVKIKFYYYYYYK